MIGEKATELIRQQLRSKDLILPCKDEAIREILNEMKILFEENQKDVSSGTEIPVEFQSTIRLRHVALMWNKRCLLSYFYHRLQSVKELKWKFQSIFTEEIDSVLTEAEKEWSHAYSRNLSQYMSSLGDGMGIDLAKNLQPPKSLYVQVRCLSDYEDFELEDGTTINLSKNSTHLIPLSQCEKLIHQGILEHIDSS